MIKNLIFIGLIISFALQLIKPLIIVADYIANTANYKANCINKAKAKLKCQGKCQMAKKMAQDEKEQQEKNEKSLFKVLDLSSKSFFTSITFSAVEFIKIKYQVLNTDKELKRSFEIFHPPSC
jgi:hypothetical protein